MTFQESMDFLKEHGNESTKNVLVKHGAKEPFYGVKVADLKTIVKKVKKNHSLSLQLYDTGNTDAMYLAGLIADESKMTPKILQDWVKKAYWYYLSEFTVPWVTAETPYWKELALKWMKSKDEAIEAAGWATYSSALSVREDVDFDKKEIESLLDHAKNNIHEHKNRVRHVINQFVIAVGTYYKDLTEDAIKIGEGIGKVKVHMGGTACKVPFSPDYINKVIQKGKIGVRRKGARC